MNEENEMKNLTVSQLITKLRKYPKDSLIVMATDEEGNHANTLRSIEPLQVTVKKHSISIQENEVETFDPDNPGGNAVYFLAGVELDDDPRYYGNAFASKA
jgi:hypothetical protein